RRLPLARHEASPEHAIGLVLIVSATAQPDAVDRRLTPARDRVHVIKFEPHARPTAVPALADEDAPPAVALPHRPLHRRRDVPRVVRGAPCPRPRGRRELLLLELLDVRIERALEHLGRSPVGTACPSRAWM